jgi:hypothetical protein
LKSSRTSTESRLAAGALLGEKFLDAHAGLILSSS